MAFSGDSIFWVEVEKIVPNPFQPRREFDQSKLKELSESIRMYGILQPLTVTRKEVERNDGTFYTEYELIAGERRLRAAKLADIAQVPVIIREGEQSEQEKLELAIIENLQREDLNAVDRALAFKQLAGAFGLSHAQVAAKVGRSREYVSNTMRLLNLPDYMLDSLKVGDITEGHARTLLMLSDRPEELDTVYREILLKKLSVREVERITRKIAHDKVRKKKWEKTDPGLIELERQFTESLGTRVQIAKTDYGGKITIDYFSDEDLTSLMDRLHKDRAAKAATSAVAVDAISDEMRGQRDEEGSLESLIKNTPLESTDDITKEAGGQSSVPEETVLQQEENERGTVPEAPNTAQTEPEEVRPDEEIVLQESQGSIVQPTESVHEDVVSHVPEMNQEMRVQHNGVDKIQPVDPQVQDPTVPEHVSQIAESLPQSEDEKSQTSAQNTASAPFVDPKSLKEKEDDSDLYTIRNFGV